MAGPRGFCLSPGLFMVESELQLNTDQVTAILRELQGEKEQINDFFTQLSS